jgi:hypothetical protein
MPVLSDPKHEAVLDNYADWQEGSYQRPEMQVEAPSQFAHPIGFIDFRRKRMAAENGRNATERRCQIRTVKLK